MTLDNFLEDKFFLSLARPKFPEYVKKIAQYEKETEKDIIYDLLIYSDFFEGNYHVKRGKEGFEIKRIFPEVDLITSEGRIINAKFFFPETYSELIGDLTRNPKIQERRIIVYPELGRKGIQNIGNNLDFEELEGIEGKIVYKKPGFFSREKIFLQGIEIDSNGKIIINKN